MSFLELAIEELEAGVLDVNRWNVEVLPDGNSAIIRSGDFYIEYATIPLANGESRPGNITIIDNQGLFDEFDASVGAENMTPEYRQICLLVSHHVFYNGIVGGHFADDENVITFYENLRAQLIWGMAERKNEEAQALLFSGIDFPDEPDQ